MENYNKKLILSIFLTLVSISLLNYIVNPYNIFQQHFFKNLLKPEAKVQERLTKPIGLKIDKRKINAVFFGTSRADLAINKDDYKNITGKEAENLAMGGLSEFEIRKMIDLALKIHPEIKEIYLAIDFQTFGKTKTKINDNRSEITDNPKLQASELCSALLSISTTGNSLWTIVKNFLGIEKRMFYSQGHKHIFINEKIQDEFKGTISEYSGRYKDIELDEQKINDFEAYTNELKKRGIKVILFVMPTHITIQNLIDNNGKREIYNEWLQKLAEISDVINFNTENEYTTEEIKPDMEYFFDGSHSTHKFGEIIIKDLVAPEPTVGVKIKEKGKDDAV